MASAAGVLILAAAGAGAVALGGDGAAGVASGAVLGGALGLARTRPLAAWLLALAALLGAAAFEALSLTAFALVAAHTFCAGRWAGLRTGLLQAAALIAALELGGLLWDDIGFWPALFVPAVGWGAGRALGEREAVAERLARRVAELEEEREAHARLAVRYERARIASELHDIVAHALSVMVVQAGAGQRLVDRDPDGAGDALAAIATAARDAEQDLARLVALLGEALPEGPAPDLALVEQLVRHADDSGLAVALRLEGRTDDLPSPLAELGYRVVQEGLTNALRYAPGARVVVLVRGGDALEVEVADEAPPAAAPSLVRGTGLGLRGLRERVDALGGTLQAGPSGAGGWRVAARLPR